MTPRSAALVVALLLAGCASGPNYSDPGGWVVVDARRGAPDIRVAIAQCRAQALGSSNLVDNAMTANAQGEVNWSALGDLGDTIAANRRSGDLRRAVMESCMASAGYVLAGR